MDLETENEIDNDVESVDDAELDEAAAVTDQDEPEETPEGEEPAPGKKAAKAGEEADAEDDADEDDEADESEEDEVEDPKEALKAAPKYKATVFNTDTGEYEQKELAIDKKFHALMKDPEGEKAVRELHEKAAGLDTYKHKLTKTESQLSEVSTDFTEVNSQIDELRGIYKNAVETGNLLKLDKWFGTLQIPYQVIENYVRAKIQFAEATPEQRQALTSHMQTEDRADTIAKEKARVDSKFEAQKKEMKEAFLQVEYMKPDTQSLKAAFEEKMGDQITFDEAVRREGALAWYHENKDLTPEQAVQRVVKQYGLKAKSPAPGQQGQSAQNSQQKKVVQRTTASIPNVQGRSSSPLKSKPESIEDLKKIYKQMQN